MIVLDKSGSMSGGFIENTKKVTILLLNYLFENFKDSKINIYSFNDKVFKLESLEKITL